jgi:CheY-like chemotaxis protein
MLLLEGPRRPILVVDDNPQVLTLVSAVLAARGYPVATATNGLEALEYLRSHPAPGLVVLDLGMPTLNGWQYLERRRSDPMLAAIPTVVLSGYSEMARSSLSAEGIDCLAKPVDSAELLQVARRFCG